MCFFFFIYYLLAHLKLYTLSGIIMLHLPVCKFITFFVFYVTETAII